MLWNPVVKDGNEAVLKSAMQRAWEPTVTEVSGYAASESAGLCAGVHIRCKN